MNKLVSMKLRFNIYIYIYIYETINFFFFVFSPFYTKFLLWVCIMGFTTKKSKGWGTAVADLYILQYTNTIITYIQTASACACVFLFGGELEGLLRVNHEIYENLGLKFLTNILLPSQRIISVITWYSGKGKGPTPHTPYIYIYIFIVIHKKVIFLIFNFFILLLLLYYIVYVKAYKCNIY